VIFDNVFFSIQTDQITDSATTNEALGGKENLQDGIDIVLSHRSGCRVLWAIDEYVGNGKDGV
jgi:hypothetical protein